MKRALLIVSLLCAGPSLAEVSPDVKKYLGSAAALFEKLEYEKALAQLKRARAKSQGPEDDLRIALYEGVVLAEMGDATAPAAFASALGMDPNANLPLVVSPKVQKVFDKAKEQVQKVLAAQAEAERARAEEQRKKDEANKPPPPAEKKPEPAPAAIVEQPRAEPQPSALKYLWIPETVVATAGLVTGTVLLVQAKSAQDALNNNVPANREEALATANRGANMQLFGWVAVGVGAAAAAAAVTTFIIGRSSGSGATASVLVTPAGAAASLSVPLP